MHFQGPGTARTLSAARSQTPRPVPACGNRTARPASAGAAPGLRHGGQSFAMWPRHARCRAFFVPRRNSRLGWPHFCRTILFLIVTIMYEGRWQTVDLIDWSTPSVLGFPDFPTGTAKPFTLWIEVWRNKIITCYNYFFVNKSTLSELMAYGSSPPSLTVFMAMLQTLGMSDANCPCYFAKLGQNLAQHVYGRDSPRGRGRPPLFSSYWRSEL